MSWYLLSSHMFGARRVSHRNSGWCTDFSLIFSRSFARGRRNAGAFVAFSNVFYPPPPKSSPRTVCPHPATRLLQVSSVEFLDKEGLRALLAKADRGEVEFTPWSAYMIDKFVFGWWDHVGDKDKLASLRDDLIHRVGSCADEDA